MKGISYDTRDDLGDAGFQYQGIKYRKKFKQKEKAEEWLQQKKDEVKQNVKSASSKLFREGQTALDALWDNNTNK